MRIVKLILSGYKHLQQSNIQKIEYTPEAVQQIILGSNGSGKTCLLSELSPLPGAGADFDKGGFKEIHIEHRGRRYELVSHFKTGGHHSFKRFDADSDQAEELNDGGTGQAQFELVRQHFNYTPQIHELIIGAPASPRFTLMSPKDRQKWLMELMPVNMNYAMTRFNSMKSRHRDTVGAVKYNATRLATEYNRLKGLGDIDEMNGRALVLREQITAVLKSVIPNAPQLAPLERELDAQLDALNSKATEWLRYSRVDTQRYRSIDEIREYAQRLKADIANTQYLSNQYGGELSELEAVVAGLAKTGSVSLEELTEQETRMRAELQVLEATPIQYRHSGDAAVIYRDFMAVSGDLADLLLVFTDNKDRGYSQSEFQARQLKVTELKKKVDHYRTAIARMEHRMEDMMNGQQNDCPKCGYVWRPGYSEQEYKQTEERVAKGKLEVEQVTAEVESHQSYLELCEQWLVDNTRWKGLRQRYPSLEDFWTWQVQEEFAYGNHRSVLTALHRWEHDLKHATYVQDLTNQLDVVTTALERLKKTGESDPTHFTQRMQWLQTAIAEQVERAEQLSRAYDDAAALGVALTNLNKGYRDIEQAIYDLIHTQNQLVQAHYNKALDDALVQYDQEYGVLNARLTEYTTLEGVVQDLERSSSQLSEDQILLAALVKELSPVDGWIAEQMTGFIGSVLSHMNEVIAQIWTYDLQVLPCGTESGEMNYKFPARIQDKGKEKIVPELKRLSAGQAEVVDFAFRLIVASYLDLHDFPIYLDEFATTFDEQHRVNAMNYIRLLCDSKRCSQVFIISHYATSHAAFTQAQICVINSSNIVVPQIHNKHVKFK